MVACGDGGEGKIKTFEEERNNRISKEKEREINM